MCRPASFVVTKTKVFWSLNDESHETIIEENNLKESDIRGNSTFVRVEVVPSDNNYTLPFSKWKYCLDQDNVPKWYDEKKVEKRCRAKLKEWRKAKIVMPGEVRGGIDIGQMVAIYGTVKCIYGGTVEYIYGGTVEYIYGGTVKCIYGGTVKCIYGGTVEYKTGTLPTKITGNPIIVNYGSLTKEILHSSQAVLIDRTKDPCVCYVGKDK
jgi:hypothetical protein